MKNLFVIVLCVLLSACAGTAFKWSDARRVQAGQSKQEVTQMLGKPTRVSTLPDNNVRYVWVWVNTFAGSTRSLVIDFDQDGKVIKAPPIPEEFQD